MTEIVSQFRDVLCAVSLPIFIMVYRLSTVAYRCLAELVLKKDCLARQSSDRYNYPIDGMCFPA